MNGSLSIVSHFGLLATATLACMAISTVLLLWYLVKHPKLGRGVRTVLLFAIGIMPISGAFTANVATFEYTKERAFCGSCHVMEPYTKDSEDPNSTSLPAAHARNPYFGSENCYVCHANYEMFGTVTTKASGLRHVYFQYTEWKDYDIETALRKIRIAAPYSNKNCMQCHSSYAHAWVNVPEHASALSDIRKDRLSCASAGCHGPAHPFSVAAKERAAKESEAVEGAGP